MYPLKMVIVHSYVSHYQRVIVVPHSAKPQTCVDSASHLLGKNASQSAPRLMTMTSPYMISKKPTCGKIRLLLCILYMVFMISASTDVSYLRVRFAAVTTYTSILTAVPMGCFWRRVDGSLLRDFSPSSLDFFSCRKFVPFAKE